MGIVKQKIENKQNLFLTKIQSHFYLSQEPFQHQRQMDSTMLPPQTTMTSSPSSDDLHQSSAERKKAADGDSNVQLSRKGRKLTHYLIGTSYITTVNTINVTNLLLLALPQN